MSRSHHDGHGRCIHCGDDGAVRRAREDEAARIDERQMPDPQNEILGENAERRLLQNDFLDRVESSFDDDEPTLTRSMNNASLTTISAGEYERVLDESAALFIDNTCLRARLAALVAMVHEIGGYLKDEHQAVLSNAERALEEEP